MPKPDITTTNTADSRRLTRFWHQESQQTSLSDALGRNIKVITPDSAIIKTDYSGNTVTVTDQAGKKRRSVTNALGQLTRVDEPNDAGQLDVSGSPVQSTNYSYNILNNLTTVSQGVQTRTFSYNSLSRLLSATNPESGLINYQYDANGNLTQKTDARQVVTNYTYDNLNRVLSRSYSAPTGLPNYQTTPNVAYTYDDVNVPFSKGKLTKVSSTVSETKYTAFDNVGRMLASQQITDGQTYNSSYLYNLSGALLEETYPSGRVVKNTLSTDGDLAKVESKKNASDYFRNYATSFVYTASGAVASMRLGNGKFETTQFNSRFQPVQIGLGNSTTDTSLWRVSYEFGELQTNGLVDSAKNSGNVAKQTIIVPNVGSNQGFTASQVFTYDSLDRLKQAKEVVGSETKWQQTFLDDRYSNRRFDASQTTTLNQQLSTNLTNPTADEQNNKFKEQDGYFYDLSGNLTQDAFGNRFHYEADGKTAKFFNTSNNTSQPDAVYSYDGESKRIKKIVGNITTIFVYDAMGKMVAEYSNESANPTPIITYITQDDYDNPRVMTNSTGQVVQRRDYMPFGEELIAGYGNRTEALGYTANQVRQGFAGQQKDDETGFNYFGERYYSSAHGRFTSPDTLMASGGAANPQTWNRYAYVVNNPVAYIDFNGQLKRDKNGKVITEKPRNDTYSLTENISTKGQWVTIRTDKGRTIDAFQNSDFSGDANISLEYNCHGLTFTQGQLLIENDQVQRILDDDYEEVKYKDGEKPQVGDVVVYYSTDPESNPSTGGIVHSTTITATNEDIKKTQVAGLGGNEMKSKSTAIGDGWKDNGMVRFRIFRRKPNDQVEPTPTQRANIARNADKSGLIKAPKVKLQTKITPRPMIPLPEPPEKKKN